MYRFSITLVAATTLLLAAPAIGFAQAKQGDKELSISGNVSTNFLPEQTFGGQTLPGSSQSSGNAFFGLGVFLTDRTQIGFAPSLSISEKPDDGVDLDLGASTNLNYYLGANSSRVKPYIGYSLLITSFKTQEGASIADNMYNAAVFGVKNYFSERAALDLNMSYGFAMKSSDAQQLNFRIGLTYLF